jgi:hypothetical protein
MTSFPDRDLDEQRSAAVGRAGHLERAADRLKFRYRLVMRACAPR